MVGSRRSTIFLMAKKKTPLALSWKSFSQRSYEGCESFGSVNTHKCNLKWQLVVLCQTSVGWHEALGLLQTVVQLEVVYPLFETYQSYFPRSGLWCGEVKYSALIFPTVQRQFVSPTMQSYYSSRANSLTHSWIFRTSSPLPVKTKPLALAVKFS